MKINIILLTLLVLITAIVTVALRDWTPKNVTYTYPIAPDFAYTSLEGKKNSLHGHKGNVVLLHFWATWCPPCIIEFPDLIDLALKQQKHFTLLAISTDKEKTDIKKFLKKLGKPLPDNFIIIHDRDKNITQALYQTIKLPESQLINTRSQSVEKIIGPQDNWNSPAWNQKIEALISE